MANPPFNVDRADAKKAQAQVRPHPAPALRPAGHHDQRARKTAANPLSNANSLWIQYFYSALNATGRAGFVMSSQASQRRAWRERDVRRKIIETGAVDVMIAIRSNFFYTRSVPCELWFFDRGKPEALRDKVLMLDARNIYRKVTRKIYDFSPEQLQNLTAIVWLYRGKTRSLPRVWCETVPGIRQRRMRGDSGASLSQFEDRAQDAAQPSAGVQDAYRSE